MTIRRVPTDFSHTQMNNRHPGSAPSRPTFQATLDDK
jgi:hypothetical protein